MFRCVKKYIVFSYQNFSFISINFILKEIKGIIIKNTKIDFDLNSIKFIGYSWKSLKFMSFLKFKDRTFVILQHEDINKNIIYYFFSLDGGRRLFNKHRTRESTNCNGFRSFLFVVFIYAFVYLLQIQRW
jgi:hypothetical protein